MIRTFLILLLVTIGSGAIEPIREEFDRSLAGANDQQKLQILKTLHQTQKKLTYEQYKKYALLEVELARSLGEPIDLAQALANLAFRHYQMHDNEDALEVYFQARDLYEQSGRNDGIALMDKEIGNMFFFALSDYKRALQYYNFSLDRYKLMADWFNSYRMLNNIAEVHFQTGNLEKAVELYISALEMCESLSADKNNTGHAASIRGNLAEVYFLLGDENKAYELLNQALADTRRTDQNTKVAATLVRFGDFAVRKREFPQALDYFKQALDFRLKIGFRDATAEAYFKLGDTYSQFGDYPKALIHLNLALKEWEILKDSIWQARTIFVIGQTRRRMGQTDQALLAFLQSMKICKTLGFRRDLVTIYQEMVDFYSSQGDTQAELQYRKLHDMVQKEIIAPTVSAKIAKLLARYEQNKTLTKMRSNQRGMVLFFIVLILGVALALSLALRKLQRVRTWAGRLLLIKDQQLAQRKKQLIELQDQMGEMNKLPVQARYKSPSPSDDKIDELLAIIFHLMKEEKLFLDGSLTLHLLASRAGTNPSILSRVINEKVGMSFSDFLNHYRVEEAKRILIGDEAGKWDIVDICFEVGFNSVASFYRVFKKHVGLTPTLFQRQFAQEGIQSPSQLLENTPISSMSKPDCHP